MSLMLNVKCFRADGATFVPLEIQSVVLGPTLQSSIYVGELTDDKGARRHAVPLNDHAEWTQPWGKTAGRDEPVFVGGSTVEANVGAKAVGNVGPAVLSKSVQRRSKDQKAGEEKDDNKE